jgi:hypothetical protein
LKARAALAVAAFSFLPGVLRAQLVPNDHWLTIETAHFHVHFPRGLEAEGKRGAVDAERAFAELSTELKPPRGKVDLVIADNIDYVNGYATSFPGNRVVVFAHPPVDAPELRNYDDWLRLVITHELTHVFHLDRAEGLWRLGRTIFGRHPALFPNAYQPAWLIEGLAVYYESRVTGAGRLEGSEHYMLARAAAEANRVPRIGELSRATTRFPGGETVYAYGSLILDYLSRTRGPEKIPQFIDKTSKLIWPLSLNRRAKNVFGISFENAWRDWRDSLVRVSRRADPLPSWQELTHEGRYVSYPRWLGDSAILYAASTGKEVASVYYVTLDGKVVRVGRRNSLDANVPQPDGSIFFTQPDYIDAFRFRNDLYVQRDGHEYRLTRGARVTQIDVSNRGEIVAVQSVPASTILVTISPDGKTVTPLTAASADVQWAEPRWSPIGNQIAAIRITSGGYSELVLLDGRTGRQMQLLVRERAIISSPSWRHDGNRLVYTSTRSGAPQVYTVLTGAPSVFAPLTSTSTGFFSPEISPNSRWLAGLDFRYDGYHVGYGPSLTAPSGADSARIVGPRENCANCRLIRAVSPPLSIESVPAPRNYSPWRSLLPTYWEPIITQSTDNGFLLGAATSGNDVIGRHSYYVQAEYNTKFSDVEGYGAYQYGGLGQPFLNLTAEQSWEHFGLVDENQNFVGDLDRRARIIGLSASFTRPRARTFASFVLGSDIESRSYSTSPDTVLSLLPERFSRTRNFPSVFAGASWSNARRPGLSISREDGVALSATARQRWESGEFSDASRSVVAVSALYKSLDLPGFAHHVIAFRGAAGIADARTITAFSVGGLSGGSLSVLEGIDVGGERRTFGVRGFSPSEERGTRALAGTLEYRAPLAAPSKRIPFVPLLFDRISVAPFLEAGRAFCPRAADSTDVCNATDGDLPWLASLGAELDFDTALQYDVPARFRLGFAAPVAGRKASDARPVSIYLTIGSSF